MKNIKKLALCCLSLLFISCDAQDWNAILQLADGDANVLQIFEVTAVQGADADDGAELDGADGFPYLAGAPPYLAGVPPYLAGVPPYPAGVPVAHITTTREVVVSRRRSPAAAKRVDRRDGQASFMDPYWNHRNVFMPPKDYRPEITPTENDSNGKFDVENVMNVNQTELNNSAQALENFGNNENIKTSAYPINHGFMKRLMKSVGQKVINNQETPNTSQSDSSLEKLIFVKNATNPLTVPHAAGAYKDTKGSEEKSSEGAARAAGEGEHSELIKKLRAIARQALPFAY